MKAKTSLLYPGVKFVAVFFFKGETLGCVSVGGCVTMIMFFAIFQVNGVNLSNVTHKEAVECLKATLERVVLTVAKPFSTSPSSHTLPPGRWSQNH